MQTMNDNTNGYATVWKCMSCGNINEDRDCFCVNCGAKTSQNGFAEAADRLMTVMLYFAFPAAKNKSCIAIKKKGRCQANPIRKIRD